MARLENNRVHELLRKLTRRARGCPGLYPGVLKSEEDFLALARWQGGASPEALAQSLEMLWRHPQEANRWINQLLLESGAAPSLRPASPSAMWSQEEAAVRAALHRAAAAA